jgi:hypothetical protein
VRWKLGGILAVLVLGGLALLLALSGSGDDPPSERAPSERAPSEKAPSGRTASRTVPFGFFGTVFNVSGGVAAPLLDQQFTLMARSGVESARVSMHWSALEPARGAYDWTSSDALVAAAARARIQLLANLLSTPAWASERPKDDHPERWPPRDPARAAAFMRALVGRYGPRGSFWAQNRSVPRMPVRWWQIWNEPMGRVHWPKRPWAPSFTRFLRATSTAVHEADPGAKVVAGSLATFGEYTSWDAARDLYRAGARRYFDVVSVHPFTNGTIPVDEGVKRVVDTVKLVRREMRRRGDAGKPVIITELSWPAALGRVPRDRLLGLETTSDGQAQRLRAAYDRLVRERRRWNLRQVYWFNWASEYDANSPERDVAFRFSGLTKLAADAFTPQPILRTYAGVAARYEGCRKAATATACE